MIDVAEVIKALDAYRKKLRAAGQPLKAAAVDRCIAIVKGLAS